MLFANPENFGKFTITNFLRKIKGNFDFLKLAKKIYMFFKLTFYIYYFRLKESNRLK